MRPTARSAFDADGRRKYLSRDEGCRFVHHAAQLPPTEAMFCLTIYYTGCRISEALTLRPQDIDQEMRVILIRSLKKRQKVHIRRLPVPAFLAKGIASVTAATGNAPIWTFSRTTGWRIIKTVMNSSAIVGIHATTKGLRHAFGVRSAMMQIPVSLIQTWMGHADSSTTAIYLAIRDSEERELIEKTW